MTKFADNNKLSAATDMSLFFANKSFNPRITIDFNETSYESTRERLLTAKAENIIDIMTNILKLMQSNLQRSKQAITTQANKHRNLIKYNPENKI